MRREPVEDKSLNELVLVHSLAGVVVAVVAVRSQHPKDNKMLLFIC